jgi:hypothetical protein
MPQPGIDGFAVISGTRIILPVEVATIDATVAIPSIATVGTIISGNVNASLTGATIMVGTVGVVGTVGTIQSGLVTGQQFFKQTNLVAASVITGSFSGTLTAQNLQDLVVDTIYGTVVTGSIISAVVGVEPQTGRQTSTIVAGGWFAGTLLTGQRLVAAGPLGALVAVNTYVATGGTLNAGTATGVYVTAEESTTG